MNVNKDSKIDNYKIGRSRKEKSDNIFEQLKINPSPEKLPFVKQIRKFIYDWTYKIENWTYDMNLGQALKIITVEWEEIKIDWINETYIRDILLSNFDAVYIDSNKFQEYEFNFSEFYAYLRYFISLKTDDYGRRYRVGDLVEESLYIGDEEPGICYYEVIEHKGELKLKDIDSERVIEIEGSLNTLGLNYTILDKQTKSFIH